MLDEVEREEYQRAADLSIPNPTVNMIFTRDRNCDRRRYNISNIDKVAMIFHITDGEQLFERDFRVYFRNKEFSLINLNILSPNLYPMTYTLFFPYGEPGWQPGMNINPDLKKQLQTQQHYYVAIQSVTDSS